MEILLAQLTTASDKIVRTISRLLFFNDENHWTTW